MINPITIISPVNINNSAVISDPILLCEEGLLACLYAQQSQK
jgi:hypothetical protein